jgi:hypothetical protein
LIFEITLFGTSHQALTLFSGNPKERNSMLQQIEKPTVALEIWVLAND